MVLLTAIAVGSAPGVPSGRWVAGCCASRRDVAHLDYSSHPSAPSWAGACRPTQGIGRPRERLGVAGPMVVHKLGPVVEARQRVGDGCPVSHALGGVLVVKRPGGGA